MDSKRGSVWPGVRLVAVARWAIGVSQNLATDRKKDYRSYYSDELAEMLARHFEPDIRIWATNSRPKPCAGWSTGPQKWTCLWT